jgi:hypothetical protein
MLFRVLSVCSSSASIVFSICLSISSSRFRLSRKIRRFRTTSSGFSIFIFSFLGFNSTGLIGFSSFFISDSFVIYLGFSSKI